MPFSKIVRDAAIQRFEYTFEAVWKAAQRHLEIVEGVEAGSPKGVFRACLEAGILTASQTQQALGMTDDRNLTAHTYNEQVAVRIYNRIPDPGSHHAHVTATCDPGTPVIRKVCMRCRHGMIGVKIPAQL